MNTSVHTPLISSDKVEGTNVYNHQGKKLGHIDNVVIDKYTGKVAYAIMSFGGFLGVGEKLHPLPWSTLKYDTDQGGYVVNLDKEFLQKAPSFEPVSPPDYADRNWSTNLHKYYNVPPYWA